MNPRPIHRSRLFWLGLPGFFFLLWLWLGTRDTLAMATWTPLGHRFGIINSDGTLQFAWTTAHDSGATKFPADQFEWETIETIPARLFPPAFTFRSEDLLLGLHQHILNLAHWLLLLAYLLLWLTATIAWHHRKRRKSRLLHS